MKWACMQGTGLSATLPIVDLRSIHTHCTVNHTSSSIPTIRTFNSTDQHQIQFKASTAHSSPFDWRRNKRYHPILDSQGHELAVPAMGHLSPLHVLVLALLSTLITASINFSPFLQPILDTLPQELSNGSAQQELVRRQDSTACPTSYINCADLGASGLCCSPSAVCSADYAGHVACCPSGAACTGTIAGVITSGTMDASGLLVTTTGTTSGGSASVS